MYLHKQFLSPFYIYIREHLFYARASHAKEKTENVQFPLAVIDLVVFPSRFMRVGFSMIAVPLFSYDFHSAITFGTICPMYVFLCTMMLLRRFVVF